ncbi:serine/threonine protein kinase [Actinomadura sp. NAK00032]|uniref:serine/threonine-protein kinase n=1 Tax=Actinomadura sp. NAK00032 TaxID=2742128 RepID=UPI0015921A09|nr:serine/threonine-protein kinase [Actinomadura sp. NAK00032]QKW33446.1 serine/threonine protein kinase [Actinomadura sp. NAK00032]
MEPLRPDDPRRAGPYRIERRLGGGGMGRVYLGRSRGGRPVAVKLVRPELADDAGFRGRFAREVEAVRRVGGFYAAQVVDAAPDDDPPWLVTAYIPGPSLHQAVEAHGPLPAETVAVMGAGLAEGLSAIHACELVHRDLKPSNVILAQDGPRVIDFGISRALDATSHTLAVVGTPGFMSPEQARGHAIGPPSDVFSFACVLAYAATGRGPFGTGPAEAIIYRIVHDEPDLTGLPAGLADLVGRCLAKDPDARPGLDDILEELADTAQTTSRWLPEPVETMVTERLSPPSTPPPSTPPPATPPPATASPTAPPPAAAPPVSPPPTAPPPVITASPPVPAARPHAGTANAATALAMLCLPPILLMIYQAVVMLAHSHHFDWFEMMIIGNLLIAVAEGGLLVWGALLLAQGRAAGRWMIAATGGAVSLHGLAAVAQFFLTGGDPSDVSPSIVLMMFGAAPLLTVAGAGAALMAAVPPTGHWCRGAAVSRGW